MKQQDQERATLYWKKSINITLTTLAVWFLCSFGAGILFRDWCDANLPQIGSSPFGFWMSQQGSIIIFVILLIVHAALMSRLDKSLED